MRRYHDGEDADRLVMVDGVEEKEEELSYPEAIKLASTLSHFLKKKNYVEHYETLTDVSLDLKKTGCRSRLKGSRQACSAF